MKVEGFSLDVNPTVEPAERNTVPGGTTGAQPALDFQTWGMAYHLDVEPCRPARDRCIQRCADLEPATDDYDDLDVLMIRTKRSRGHRRSMPPAPTALPAPACAPDQHARPAMPALPAPARAARAKARRTSAQDASATPTTSPSLSQMEMAEPHRQRDWRYIQLGKSQHFVSLWVLLVVVVLGLVLLAGAIIVALWLMSH